MSESSKNRTDGYDVFCGVDVGKADHHACALDPSGKKVHDRALPNEQDALVEVLTKLKGFGRVLVVVDQPAAIGALVIAVARLLGIDVGYLPGLAMRRIADLHPGEGKTDARDAFIIADAARTMPHTLRRVGTDDEILAELGVLAGEWTQANLGKRLGWAPSVVGHLEQGRRDVTVDDLTDLCRAFGVPAATLLFGASPDDLKPSVFN